jgi:hypothetical protein
MKSPALCTPAPAHTLKVAPYMGLCSMMSLAVQKQGITLGQQAVCGIVIY